MTVIKKQVPSSDGIHSLYGVVVLPEGEPRGYVQVVHGMCEYMGRYQELLCALARAGYIAFGYDHLGHGKTAAPEEWGYIADRDGWEYLIRDVTVFQKAVTAEYGPGPWYLFGHSMGSFIVRCAVAQGAAPAKLVVCGTGGPNPASGAGLLACRIIKALRGGHHVSRAVIALAFGRYNKRFAREKDRASWLTKDSEVRKNYRKDPMCRFPFQVSAMEDLVRLQRFCNQKKALAAFPPALPTLFISGDQDPVGSYGKGVKKVVRALRKAGCQASVTLYENCRHEIFNDSCRDQATRDLLSFLEG